MQQMSPGTMILGIFAVLFGLIGAYAAKQYFQEMTVEPVAQEKPVTPTFNVPVAVVDLPAGRTITQTDVAVTKLTAKQIAEYKYPNSWIEKSSQIVGRTLREPVKVWTPFEPKALYPEGLGPSLSERLAPGQRAVTLPFMGSAAEAGLINPGAVVDVLFRATGDGKKIPADATMTLLRKVQVLAVGQAMLEGASKGTAKTVTLAVSDIQAQALKAAEDRGVFSLALRNDKDDLPTPQTSPIILHELLGIKEPEKPFTTQVYRHGQLTTVTFDEGGRQTIVSEPPYGLPVADLPAGTPVVPASLKSDAAGASGAASSTPTKVQEAAGSRAASRSRLSGSSSRGSR